MGKWDKLIAAILAGDRSLRFAELCKALVKMGYAEEQPGRGGSHHVFRKDGCAPITIPKHGNIKKAYIELVAEAVRQYQEEDL